MPSATWGNIAGPPAIAEAFEEVRGAVDSAQFVLEEMRILLDVVKLPLELVEQVVRALLDAAGLEQALMALSIMLVQILKTFTEANAWFLPIFPLNAARLITAQSTYFWQNGPTFPDERDSAALRLAEAASLASRGLSMIDPTLRALTVPGVDYIASTLDAALNDVWDPQRPLLGEKAYVGGMVLLVGADEPESLGPAAEVLAALTEGGEIAQFLASLSGRFQRLASMEVRDQGSWPDFYRAPLIDLVPTLADEIRALQDFAKVVGTQRPLYVDTFIESLDNLIEFVLYVSQIIEGIVKLAQLIASLKASVLAVPISPVGPHGFADIIRSASNPPSFTYAVGLIALVGSENYEDIDVGYQMLQALFPIS